MALPIQPNTTCDIYRNGTAPPAAPAVAGVACYLQPDWRAGQDQGDRANLPAVLAWTHVLLMDTSVDVRDCYLGSLTFGAQDMVYIPDQNGTPFRVIFIERVHRGRAEDHKRVYVDRQTPTWPTNEL
ncbi:MAG: hypothetical protein L0Y71_01140 [Gemmataceae bacterium]|nr:hypothetical protein [Gemmataceae bacterium]